MKVLHVLGRAALGLPFIVLGYGSARGAGDRAEPAEQLGLPGPDLVVRANGAAMVGGGAALAVGVLPRAAAVGLVACLVPTTLAGHPFWETDDPAQRHAQKIQFMKNVGLAGALLAYASRDGR